MSLGKLKTSSPFKKLISNLNTRVTMNLSILENHLYQCHNLKHFNQILSQMISTGFIKDTYAASKVVKFSTQVSFIHLQYSRQIFDHIENPNEFTWNTMMKAYLLKNCPCTVIYMFKLMLENNVEPDNYTYPILIQACAIWLLAFEGKEIHTHILKLAMDLDVYVQNTLINMYSVFGDMIDARKLFDRSLVLDSVSWNSILAGYVQKGDVEEARLIFRRMPEKNIIASNSMIVLLGKARHAAEACHLFDEMPEKDMVSWSALISCYEQNGMYRKAFTTFMNMRSTGVAVDEVVIVTVLSLCEHLSVIDTGKTVHAISVKIGVESYVNLQNALIHLYSGFEDIMAAQKLFDTSYYLDQISWNSMISGYVNCGLVGKARALFDSMPIRDVISWSSMISGYAQDNRFSETLALFHEMQVHEVRPDETTLVSVISACTHLAALDQGRWIHAFIRRCGLKVNTVLGTTLIDMYMKCGCVDNALEVFHEMEEKGVSTWNAVIGGLALNGTGDSSLMMFSEMKASGVMPNGVTFVGILGACRHMGLVNLGYQHFNSMTKEYKIEPNVKHYGCMVDLLGRAGLLKEAEELIESMPMMPDSSTWGALLGACKKHGNNKMGEKVGRKLNELQPDHHGFHVLRSNICASEGKWDKVSKIRDIMMQQGVEKIPGCSLIEANGVVHEFLAGDKEHPQMIEIEKMLDEIAKRLIPEGYAPCVSEVTLEIDEE